MLRNNIELDVKVKCIEENKRSRKLLKKSAPLHPMSAESSIVVIRS